MALVPSILIGKYSSGTKPHSQGVRHSQHFPRLDVAIILSLAWLHSLPQKPNQDRLPDSKITRFSLPSFHLIAYKWKFWNSPKGQNTLHLTKFSVPENQDKNFPNECFRSLQPMWKILYF
jgi:hypothetical protein